MRQAFAALGPPGIQLYAELLQAVKVALAGALHDVFLAGSGVAAAGVLTVLFLREVPLRGSHTESAEAAAQSAEAAAQSAEATAVAGLPPVRGRDEPVLVERRRAS